MRSSWLKSEIQSPPGSKADCYSTRGDVVYSIQLLHSLSRGWWKGASACTGSSCTGRAGLEMGVRTRRARVVNEAALPPLGVFVRIVALCSFADKNSVTGAMSRNDTRDG